MDRPSPVLALAFRRVDGLLRQVATGHAEPVADTVSLRELLGIAIACAALYGAAMGLFAATTRADGGLAQLAAAMIKVPLLFALTIAVTFPSFYVLCTVSGCSARASQLLRMQLFGVALACATLASLAPVVAFFTLSTESHGFMVLLSVVMFAVAATVGFRTIRGRAGPMFSTNGAPNAARGKSLLRVWVATALVVGAQSSWILRPLIGRPEDAFLLVSPRESNALGGFLDLFGQMVRGS